MFRQTSLFVCICLLLSQTAYPQDTTTTLSPTEAPTDEVILNVTTTLTPVDDSASPSPSIVESLGDADASVASSVAPVDVPSESPSTPASSGPSTPAPTDATTDAPTDAPSPSSTDGQGDESPAPTVQYEVSVVGDATYIVNDIPCGGSGTSCPVAGDKTWKACHSWLESYQSDDEPCVAPWDGSCEVIGTSDLGEPVRGCVWNKPTDAPSSSDNLQGDEPSATPDTTSTEAPTETPATTESPTDAPTDAPSPSSTDAQEDDVPSVTPSESPSDAPSTTLSSDAPTTTDVPTDAPSPSSTDGQGDESPAPTVQYEVSVVGDATYIVNDIPCGGSGTSCPVAGDKTWKACHSWLESYQSDDEPCVAPWDGSCEVIGTSDLGEPVRGCVWNKPTPEPSL
ncbi:hypothetical protein Ae201684P_013926 [Aphanomyces euteiches]|nr:hypothetical protein Ae201684P_013926 [Aphanomyces euteiches]